MLIDNVCILERGDAVALFNPFYPNPVFVSLEELKRFKQGIFTEEEWQLLRQNHLINEGKQKTIAEFRSNYPVEKEVMTLYLIITRKCNSCCDYCFEKERQGFREYNQEIMTRNIAERALELFAGEYSRNKLDWNYQVILYGGEPILNWDVLTFVVGRINLLKKQRKLPDGTKIILNTNGILVDNAKAEFLSRNKVSVTVSLDGTKEFHDLHRKDSLGRGTFEQAIAGYRKLLEFGVEVSPSLTISSEVAGRTVEVAKSLYDQLGFKALGLNPLMAPAERFKQGASLYHQQAARDIIDCFMWCRERGINEDRAMRKVDALVDLRPHITDCCAYGNQLVVQPDGSIGICHASGEHNYCSVWEYTSPYNADIISAWIRRLPLFQKKCENCEAIFLCGGGCAHSAKLLGGGIGGVDSGFCTHTKSMLQFLIWDIYDSMV